MKYVDEFRDRELARRLVEEIRRVDGRVSLMEVCGTHTVAIFRHGLRSLLPEELHLLSGPGCPVCVTPDETLDKAILLSQKPEVMLVTFGDMMRVPGSHSSLQEEKARGRDIRIVYSSLDALKLARRNRGKEVVFLGVGFETTSPSIAHTVWEAYQEKVDNFSLLTSLKLIPPAMRALLDSGEVSIDGFICPGHVSTIIGSKPYQFIPENYGIPCVISGFEPIDILQSILMLIGQIKEGNPRVEIQYKRAVREEGNPRAMKRLLDVFEVSSTSWRGLGELPASGLKLREEFAKFDAEKRFKIKVEITPPQRGCRCGEVLRGVISPPQCSLFARKCTPEHPVGPCMVSGEGTCAAYFKYGRKTVGK